MTISFDLPVEIGQRLGNDVADLGPKTREALLVELHRDSVFTQHQLGEALGLDDYETDGLLKRYGVGYELTVEEFEEQRAFLREGRGG